MIGSFHRRISFVFSGGDKSFIFYFFCWCVSIFAFVDHTAWCGCTICPLSVSIYCGKYLAAFKYVKPGQVSKLPAFMDFSQVDLIGKPAAACRNLTSASTLGISYALNAEIVACFIFGLGCGRSFVIGRKAKRQNFGMTFYQHTLRMGLPVGENTVTSFLVNKTGHLASQMGPTAMSVLVKFGMMCPVLWK